MKNNPEFYDPLRNVAQPTNLFCDEQHHFNAGYRYGLVNGRWNGLLKGFAIGVVLGFSIGIIFVCISIKL